MLGSPMFWMDVGICLGVPLGIWASEFIRWWLAR